MALIYRVNALLPGSKLNKISQRLATVLDIKELLDVSRSSVALSESGLKQGQLVLERALINPLAKLALVIIRKALTQKLNSLTRTCRTMILEIHQSLI